jgi:hypothetical protein
MSLAAAGRVLKEGTTSGTSGVRNGAGLLVVKSNIGATGRVWEDTVVVIVDGDGKRRESEPATGVIAEKAAAVATAAVDADGKQGAIQGRDVIDSTELDGVLLEFESDGTDAEHRNATAIGEGDSKVKVGDATIRSEIRTGVPEITGGAGVNTAVFDGSGV